MKIVELKYSELESRWILSSNPSLHMTDFESACAVMHPETRRSILEPGELLDSMLISALVREGVDEIAIRSVFGGPVIHCVIEMEHA